MKMSRKQRQAVFNKSKGKCWYCGTDLSEKGWHADHIKPVLRNLPVNKKTTDFGEVPSEISELLDKSKMQKPHNDTIENIVPACAPCNLFKSTLSVEEFRRELEMQTYRARKTSVNFRTAERFGLIDVKEIPVTFWFER